MTDLYQIKAQMRKEHRILKTRKFFRNKSVVIGARSAGPGDLAV